MSKRNFKLIIFFVFVVVGCLAVRWDEKLLLPVKLPQIEVEYKEQPAPFTTFSDKLWLHGVDGYDQISYLDDYKGMEIDIHYNDQCDEFYVTHDPDPENYLVLDCLLDSIQGIENYHIWLDFKNLNKSNYQQALPKLTSVCNKFGISRANIIVESMEASCLSDYTRAGYNTSCYLPIFSPYKISDEQIIEYVETIAAKLNESYVTFVSADYKLYHFIKRYFPDANILLWQHHRNLLSPYLRGKMLKDPNVKVLLVR